MTTPAEERIRHEQGLRAAVLSGSESAWETLYLANCDALFRYIRWRCAGSDHLADEIAQDAWMTAVRNIRRFDPHRGSFQHWLRGVAVNLLSNHFRSRTRRATQSLSDADDFAEQRNGEDERVDRIGRTLCELPSRYEELLRAKYLDGLSVEAIAETRGETSKAIESALSRAREAFRDIYTNLEETS